MNNREITVRSGRKQGKSRFIVDETIDVINSDVERMEQALEAVGMEVNPRHHEMLLAMHDNRGFVVGSFTGKLHPRKNGRRTSCSRTSLGYTVPIWFGWMFVLNPMLVARYPYTVLAYECHFRSMASIQTT